MTVPDNPGSSRFDGRDSDYDPKWEAVAHLIFSQAIKERRCGELLTCLFEGGSATVDGGLVLLPAEGIRQLSEGRENQ